MTVKSPDSVALGGRDQWRMALDSAGVLWISPMFMRHAVVGLDPRGSQPSYWMTHRGLGPTEFTEIDVLVAGPGDTLHVFGNGKHNRYSPTGIFAGTHLAPWKTQQAVYMADGSYVMNGAIPTATRAGYTLHWISAADEPLRSFGPVVPSFEFDLLGSWHTLAVGHGGNVWSARQNVYQIDLWDRLGQNIRRVVREVDWFRPWKTFTPPFRDPAPPRIYSISEDDQGRLWVMIYVPDQEFRPLPRPDRSSLFAPMGEDHPSFDTLVEVIDVNAGKVLASRRFESMLGAFLRDQHVPIPSLDSDGEQVFRIMRLTLEGAR